MMYSSLCLYKSEYCTITEYHEASLPLYDTNMQIFALSAILLLLGASSVEAARIEKRVTCDILAQLNIGGNSIGSAACAAHCLLKGYSGGYCNSRNVCVCR
ncbi:tenecin-1-like [Haliotis rubra]|uniref:tenecin-1-like n=1 Tax=Haliotis rubra TaxID=36100 RepID=UPI001EE543B0|nr:tenecin-1-like [Haliotis rubra]